MDSSDHLDKSFEAATDLGSIVIRVIVLPRPAPGDADSEEDGESAVPDQADDEDDTGEQKRPVDSYLESSKRGKGSIVFLVSGQRQHQLDNSLIQRELQFKYLRHRMMIIVDVDGLSVEAMSRLMSGARQGFYQGEVYEAMIKRVVATLKDDPDLVRLEEAAADAIASLRTGNRAVKEALDKLISEHAPRGRKEAGHQNSGAKNRGLNTDGDLLQTVDVAVEGHEGSQVQGPALRVKPDTNFVRIHPDTEHSLRYFLFPIGSSIASFQLETNPPVPDLVVKHEGQGSERSVTLLFPSPEDDTEPHYPIRTSLRAIAHVEGAEEPRVVDMKLTIAPRAERKKRPYVAPVLLDSPTMLRLITRQPISMVEGGPDVHVKLKWDGKDELLIGSGSPWRREVTASGEAAPIGKATFTQPKDGRFELVLPVPEDAEAGTSLSWRIEMHGPAGETLTASFGTVVIEPLAPRHSTVQLEGGTDENSDYEIAYLQRADWNSVQCFDAEFWTESDSGAFDPPTGDRPLTLYINMDYGPLVEFLEDMTKRQLAETTIEQRKNRYTTHMAYHLYQMHLANRDAPAPSGEEASEGGVQISEEAMRLEARRVATTMLQLMDRG